MEYEKRKAKRVQYYESVRTAQTVQIEDIPLPDAISLPPPKMPADFHPQIAPPNMRPPPPGLQHPHDPMADTAESQQRDDPGVPPFVPPNLFIMRELDSDYESDLDGDDDDDDEKRSRSNSVDKSSEESDNAKDDDRIEGSVPKPTSVQQRILAIAGQKYDDFMKELENVHKKKDQERSRAGATHDEDNERVRSRNDDSQRRNDSGPSNSFDVPPPPRRDNPVMIPNNAGFPAPPMAPPPFTSKMPGLPPPPPPPMGMTSFDVFLQFVDAIEFWSDFINVFMQFQVCQ